MKAAVCLLCLFLALGLCACEKDARYLDDKGNPLPDNEKMITAVLNRDLETVKKLHKRGVPLNLFDDAGDRTPLHWAAAMGEIEIMTYLLDNGVDPNIHDLSKERIEWWNTPLHETTYHGRIDAARLLLERGAKVDGVAPSGGGAYSPYVEAARYKKVAMCRFLLEYGADGKYEEISRHSALTYAMSNAYPPLELIKLTVEAGADVNAVISASSHITNLGMAAVLNRKDIYDYLISVGADPYWKDEFGNTPDDYAKGKPYPDEYYDPEPFSVEEGKAYGIEGVTFR